MNLISTNELIFKLIKHKMTLSSVESFTGGLFSSDIIKVPNSSKVFLGGLVTYSLFAKSKLLDISNDFLNKYGTISKEASYAMALKTQEIFNTDIVLSFTGNAGPKAMEDMSVGTYFISIYFNNEIKTFRYKSNFSTRNEIRKEAVNNGIKLINEILIENKFE